MKQKNLIRTAFPATLPVLAGYAVLGIGFGMILKSKGYGVWWSLASAVFIYAGSMQYVMIDLLTGGAGLLTTALTTLMVNARHLFYGVSMVQEYQGAGRRKPYLIFALTDETYSLVCSGAPEGVSKHAYFFAVSAFDQLWWIIGCVTGSLLGSALKINTEGLDFAMTALFITVFVEQWLSTRDHVPALIGLIASLICLLIFGTGSFLIPSMICIAVLLTVKIQRGRGAEA